MPPSGLRKGRHCREMAAAVKTLGRRKARRRRPPSRRQGGSRRFHSRRRTVSGVGRTAEGLFHLAGEDELAKRMRASTRRRQRPSKKAEEPAAEDRGPESETSAVPAAQVKAQEAESQGGKGRPKRRSTKPKDRDGMSAPPAEVALALGCVARPSNCGDSPTDVRDMGEVGPVPRHASTLQPQSPG